MTVKEESNFKKRQKKIFEKIEANLLDGLLITDRQNRLYLSGFSGSSGALLFTRKKVWLITDARYSIQARQQVFMPVVLQKKTLPEETVACVTRLGLKKIGLEARKINLGEYLFYKKNLPKVSLEALNDFVEELRLIKDESEQQKMRRAAQIADKAFHYILKHIKVGVSERQIAARIDFYMKEQGAEGNSFETIVASGVRSALPHGTASDKKIKAREMVVLDFGCIADGYCSDMTRTICVGNPAMAMRRVYQLVLGAQQAALKVIKAGINCRQADLAARSVIDKGGYKSYFTHGLGHGVGLNVHEDPRVGPSSTQELKEGMTVTVEPGIYLEGKFGVRIEDLVLVNRQGCENFCKSGKELICV
jgi:Xaa-Pro aminopeptidase